VQISVRERGLELPLDAPENEPGCEPEAGRNGGGKDGGKVRLLTLGDLDRRTVAARKVEELISDIQSDLGGREELSTLQVQLVQRAAVLGAILEDMETRWLKGEPMDATAYSTVINAQKRLAELLGIKRLARDVTPSTLRDHIMGHRPQSSLSNGHGHL
jgi:hypothetical protein